MNTNYHNQSMNNDQEERNRWHRVFGYQSSVVDEVMVCYDDNLMKQYLQLEKYLFFMSNLITKKSIVINNRFWIT